MSTNVPATSDYLTQQLEHLKTPADVEYWGKAAYWTLDEFVALSLNLEPRIATWRKIEPLVGRAPFAREYLDRREIVSRASQSHELYNRPKPAECLEWADRHDIACPQNLVEQVEKYSVPAEPEPSAKRDEEEAKPKDISSRERSTFQKIILGLALEKYRYKPEDGKSEVPQKISSALELHGLSVSAQTIREKLREAAQEHYEGGDTED